MTPNLAEVEALILDLTNAFRSEQRLGAVRREAALDKAARDYAGYLARTGKFSHTADGRRFSDRIGAAGYAACFSAENLALNGDSRGFQARQLARDAVEGWKNSPGHRKNMMAQLATDIGVGVAKAPGAQTYYSVQLFGRPEALRQKFRIENRAGLAIAFTLDGKERQLEQRVILTLSTCQPSEIVLQPGAGYQLAPRTPARFVSSDGDTFVATRGSDGRVTMRHLPRTR